MISLKAEAVLFIEGRQACKYVPMLVSLKSAKTVSARKKQCVNRQSHGHTRKARP